MTFRKLNNLTGWAVFAASAAVYLRTVEPTASWWDCGEFIAASYKLLIGHPPGAPFFLLVARLFTLMAGNDVTQIAYWINILSALCSAGTVLFLCWTITLLARKLVTGTEENYAPTQTFGILAAGIVGSLSYAFSDTSWFSAVEAEVYAMSSLFTAFAVWAMLKWERITDQAAATRWLVLIAYAVGLSIGTHLLNLVTLPALAFIFYFKKYKPTFKGGLLTFAVGGGLVLALMTGMRTIIPGFAGGWDVFFVNTLGLPFGSGVAAFGVLFIGALVYGIWYSIRKQNAVLHTALLAFTFVLIGFSSYSVLIIRANYQATFKLNDPKDAPGFMYYMNMEQYGGGRPLIYGPQFTAEVIEQEQGDPMYVKGKDQYEVYSHRLKNTFDPKHQSLLPRLWSNDKNHPQIYRQMTGLRAGEKPSMGQNLGYMFTHQWGHMYWRYFMWNFAGRDSDKQDAGWTTTLTATKNLPPDLARNQGHNQFFFLPLLLGLAGAFYQYRKHRHSFFITGLLFFLTGLALVTYLNPPPVEPRERDYIYVGSFYAFAIWMGLGVLAVAEGLGYLLKREVLRPVLAGAICLGVPLLLVSQNWDDHDRSGRYIAIDSAKNILNSCAPNAILFTNGDNDTYPLIYAQEVEGVRPDVRICISQFMGTDWYIDQLKNKVYQADALPISLKYENYVSAVNNQLLYHENPEYSGGGINLPAYLKLIRENNPGIQVGLQNGESINILPSSKLVLPVNKEAVLKKGFISEELAPLLQDRMTLELDKKSLFKDDLVFLDVLTQNNWERPIYFTSMFLPNQYHLEEHTQIEGLVYRLLPVRVPGARDGFLNSQVAYQNLMHNTAWRGINNPGTYYEETSRNWLLGSRLAFVRTAEQLIREDQTEKARQVLVNCLKKIPDQTVPYDQVCSLFVAPLLKIGEREKAMALAKTMSQRADKNLAYYLDGGIRDQNAVQENLFVLNQLAVALSEAKHPEAPQYQALFEKHYRKL